MQKVQNSFHAMHFEEIQCKIGNDFFCIQSDECSGCLLLRCNGRMYKPVVRKAVAASA